MEISGYIFKNIPNMDMEKVIPYYLCITNYKINIIV